uniref:Uncharacterized protein n=1 Tax=Anguilla anguilla TaxID=7936 RepID=A0A0E9P8N9_ANGAN
MFRTGRASGKWLECASMISHGNKTEW